MFQETTEIIKKPGIAETKDVISVRGLHKTFGKNNPVLQGVDLRVQKGENLVVLGKSGSGK